MLLLFSSGRDAAKARCDEMQAELRGLDAAEAGLASAMQSKAIAEAQIGSLQSSLNGQFIAFICCAIYSLRNQI